MNSRALEAAETKALFEMKGRTMKPFLKIQNKTCTPMSRHFVALTPDEFQAVLLTEFHSFPRASWVDVGEVVCARA